MACGARGMVDGRHQGLYGDTKVLKSELDAAGRVERFRTALAATDIRPEHVVSHGAYVLNVATPDEAKWTRARDGLAKELERSTALGIGIVCFHPGAATDGDRAAAAKRIGAAIVHALDSVKGGETRLLVEKRPAPARRWRDGRGGRRDTEARTEAPARAPGTAWTRATSGHRVTTSPSPAPRSVAIPDEFEQAAGEPRAFSPERQRGRRASHRDRHALSGAGKSGAEAFGWLLADPGRAESRSSRDAQLNADIAEDGRLAGPVRRADDGPASELAKA